ncbi:MAG TPA: NAD(P)-dependent oxidoreductase [Polyangiaceae bacterium]|nr:NAD(P)-dependent oxidoreductase [Polyangiaceae bacterium]
MSASKFVVTGATGHLGRSVVQLLAEHGEVVAASRSGALPEAPFSEAARTNVRGLAIDVERDDCVEPLRAELGPEVALVHLAAWHPPRTAGTTPEDRRRLVAANTLGTLRVLEAARRAAGQPHVACVVYASTFEVYGIPEQPGAVLESSRLNPITDYGATKLSGEDHLLAFAYEERARVVALRFPAIYGPGELTARALPNFLRSAASGERPTVHGSGRDLRDQLHVRDAAASVLRAIVSNASGIFNIADGEPHSIWQLAESAMAAAGLSGAPNQLPSDRQVYNFHMSIERAKAELGFEPRVSLLDGMKEQLLWLRQRSSP